MKTPLALLLAVAIAGCGARGAAEAASQFPSEKGTIEVSTVAEGLEHPWGLAFLPDGRKLVTERPGRLRIVDPDGTLSAPVEGVPEVWARGQGGLLDVAVDPEFAKTPWIYLSFSEPGDGGAGTAVARGKLVDGALREAVG